MDSPIVSKNLYISYRTGNGTFVGFGLEFGEGTDSSIEPLSELRTKYDTPYDIEMYKSDGQTQYRVIAEEGMFVMKVNNIEIRSETEDYEYNYEYGLRVVVDLNEEPKYINTTDSSPSNSIERDGIPWDLKCNTSYNLDQNGKARFQWSTARALKYGKEPTERQKEMGVEERHKNSGLIFVTCVPIFKKTQIPQYTQTDNVCRGGIYRGSTAYRGGNISRGSSAARVGYGSAAATNSSVSEFVPIHDGRYILPLRFRIANSDKDNMEIKCAKNIEFAQNINQLQQSTGVMEDTD